MRKIHGGLFGNVWGSIGIRLVVLLALCGVTAGTAHGEVYVVNQFNSICGVNNFDCGDDVDAQPGDGVAERILGGGQTTLRSAIEEANALEGHDIIMIPARTFFLRYDLPPLTDPDGVTIMSMEDEHFVLDGSTVTERLLGYRDALLAKFNDLDGDMSEDLTYGETLGLTGSDLSEVIHNFGDLRVPDFEYLDTNDDNVLDEDELRDFRGAGSGLTISSTNNNIIGLTIVNFHERGIVIDGEDADNNVIQGCYIGLLGTDAADRENARLLLEEFATADGNQSEGLSLNEARTIVTGLTAAAFDRIDADGSDDLSEAELTTAGALLDTEIAQLLIDDFSTADEDESGALNLAEAQTIVEALDTDGFDRLDGNGNGQLTVGELNTVIANGDTVGTTGTTNGNHQHGIAILGGADNNIIGGSNPDERNVISGNGTNELKEILNADDVVIGYLTLDLGHGIYISGASTSNNVVQGNYIGVDVSGVNPVPNGYAGVVIDGNASDNLIGGVGEGEGNIIARNGAPERGCPLSCGNANRPTYGKGVYVQGVGSTNNLVRGNVITRNVTDGVHFSGLVSGEIGGALEGAGNVISGHVNGSLGATNIRLSGCSNIRVEGNDSTASSLGFGLEGGSDLIIGSPGFGNRFSSNTSGVSLSDATNVFFYSNYVGVDATGMVPNPNSFSGIYITNDLDNVRIGGAGEGEGNLISGNANDGIVVYEMDAGPGEDPVLFIQGNLIGTNVDGTAAVPNELMGILVGPQARRVLIGGTNEGEGNVISGNGVDGIRVGRRPNPTGTPDNIKVFGNRIGLAVTGTATVPNGANGVALLQVDEEVELGGFGAGEANVITGNGENGVRIKGGDTLDVSSLSTVRGNTIYGNTLKGIALEETANESIAAPVVTGVGPIVGTAPANTEVDIFSDDADEGLNFLGSAAADGSGNFTLAVDIGSLTANNITATATNTTTGSTSEFSEPLSLTPPTLTTNPMGVSVVEGEGFSLTVVATGSEPITYQWEVLPAGASEFEDVVDDATVSGAQTATLTNSGARLTDAGAYRCVATNILGDTPSSTATVTVIAANTDTAAVSTVSDVADGDTQSPAHLIIDPGDDGVISLREAIIAANNRAGDDTISFTVGGTIFLTAGLPSLTDDGTTIDGGGTIVIDGSALGGSLVGLQLTSADNVLRGLTIVNFPGSGVEVLGASATGNVIADNFIGTNGTTAMGNGGHGVLIRNGASDNVVGGADADDRNIIASNTDSGVSLTDADTTGNRVIGNYIGVNSLGSGSLANGEHGVLIQNEASDNEVGGTAEGEGNLISANSESGVYISGTDTTGNVVAGNRIGLNASGAATLGNVSSGVTVAGDASDNVIGGTDAGAGNTISGNGTGVRVDGAASLGNTIRGNEITANLGVGIDLNNGGNGDIDSPEIDSITPLGGTATANSTVEVFADADDEGATLIGTATADGAGLFEVTVDLTAYAGQFLTATATDADGNTSEFSDPVLVDLEPPVLTLLGSASLQIECGSGPYVDAGATATDDVDGNITNDIVVTILQGNTPVTEVSTTGLGSYTIRYEISDNAGQEATPLERTITVVDTEAPDLVLNGNSALVVNCASTYEDGGATATDACEGDVNVTVTGSVNTATPGVYVLTYEAQDSQGNVSTPITRTVTVADTTSPVITLLGSGSVTLECGTGYLDAGATISDNCDADVSITTTNPVEPGTVGVYTVRYNATDASGNMAAEVIRVVNVVDTTVPVITLVGGADLTVACSDNFADPGATVQDACDGDLPAIVSGVVNSSEPGNYTLTYTASDAAGNVAVPVTRIVRVEDTTVPTIILNGSATVNVACNGMYDELGATASDACDGDLTNNVVISGSVDTTTSGQYFVNYDVTDSFGNVAQRVTRTVIVAQCPAPCETQCESDAANEIDEDGDGLSACVEACLGTSDNSIDSDGDGVPDNVEEETGSSPSTPDSEIDLDGDGLSQLEEFLIGSDPTDPNSPAESFFIASNGANATVGGSAAAPWNTISYALTQVSPSSTNPVRLIVGAGNYAEDVELAPWVTLVGATGTVPRIEGTVFGANNSALENLEIAAFTSDDVMLVMDNVAMTVTNVVFRGSAARPAAGIMVDGSNTADSVVDGCLFTSLSVGIDVGGALPMIRRCTFENTSVAGVFVRATASISSGVSLGNVSDPSTGSNLFAGVVEGRAVINSLSTTLRAEQNDWGTTDVNAIQSNLVSGPVDVEPLLVPGTAGDTSSLFVTVWTAANQTRIATAEVTVTDSSGASVSVTRNRNGVYALPVLRSGNYAISVSAFGFEEQSTDVVLAVGELGSRIVALQSPVIKEGGPSCSPAKGPIGGIGSDMLLVALLLGVLLVSHRAGILRGKGSRN